MLKSSQLQIRVSPEQKATIKRLADAAGQTLSQYVLAQVIPPTHAAFARVLADLTTPGGGHAAALTELGRLLAEAPAADFARDFASPEVFGLPATLQNYVAAMVERTAHERGLAPPGWVLQVPPLERPHFMWSLQSLRPHQIRVTPVAFKRRNLFFDPAGGPRV